MLRPALADVADEMIQAVATVPAYSRPLEGPFGDGIRQGVQEALRHFLAEIQAGGYVARPDVYSALGRGEMRAGRSMESLLSAYRIGARVAWRRFAAAGVQAGLEPDTLYLLAESIFAYIDVLSSESAQGHALEQSAAASEAELRRRRLVRMLVRDPAPEPAAVEAAAADAGWALPRTLAVLAIAGEQRSAVASRLPAGAISEAIGEFTCALITDPDGPGRRALIERAVQPIRGARRAGHHRRLDARRGSVSRALARRSSWPTTTPGLIAAAEHAGDLLLRSDQLLAGELAQQWLSPLDGLSPGSRARLTETLACGWPNRGGWDRSRIGSRSTRRLRVTGSGACGSCSATRSTTPTAGSGWRWRCARRSARADS